MDASTKEQLLAAFKTLRAPFVAVRISDLGGGPPSVALGISFDAQETWKYGIFENSKYAKIMVHFRDHSINFLTGNKVEKMRKVRFTSVDDAVAKIQRWIDKNTAG